MKFTRASSYAICALIHMVELGNGKPIPSYIIAKSANVPPKFLLRMLGALVSGGVLKSIKGPNGGYSLAKSLSTVNLLEVIELVDGTIVGGCSIVDDDGHAASADRLNDVAKFITDKQRESLKAITLAQIMKSNTDNVMEEKKIA